MSPLTLYLGKFFGLFCLLLTGVMLARPKAALDAVTSLMANAGLVFVTGLSTMAAGVATVVAHNVWTGGALPVAVTMLGWLMLIKGTMLMAVPPSSLASFYRVVGSPGRYRLFLAVDFLASLWLTWAAFRA